MTQKNCESQPLCESNTLSRAERRRQKRDNKFVAIHRGMGFTMVTKGDLERNAKANEKSKGKTNGRFY